MYSYCRVFPYPVQTGKINQHLKALAELIRVPASTPCSQRWPDSVTFDPSQNIPHWPHRKAFGGKKTAKQLESDWWCACDAFIRQDVKPILHISCIKQIKNSKLYIFHTFSHLQLKDAVHAFLSWDKATLNTGKKNMPEMINGKETRALSKQH